MTTNGVMRRDPSDLPRKPGVFVLLNNKSHRCGYVAYASDLQKRAHSFAHMLQNPKTHWAIRDLPKAPAGEWVYTMIEETPSRAAADRLIRLTKKSLAQKKYRVIEGGRRAMPLVTLNGTAMPLTEAILKAKCSDAYITVWRRLDRGWTAEQALGLADPPARWDTIENARRRRRRDAR